MKQGWTAILWTLCAIVSIVFAWLSQPFPAEEAWIAPFVGLVCLVTLVDAADSRRQYRPLIASLARRLRRSASLYWAVLLVVFFGGLALWVVPFQPTNGRSIRPDEIVYLACWLWLLLYLLFYGGDASQVRAMGAKLAKSRLTGVLITITTLLVLFTIGEAYLRLFYVTTDGYGFTAMNYHWYRNFYWGRYNSAGYRDAEPKPNADGLTRVAVLGDSFAMGHGINDLADTFPQILERDLGDAFDVNVIAQSGWDTNIQLFELQTYPFKPNIVILSYYLNDIDYLLQDAALNPDNRFTFPDNPALRWFILNFFVPNYVYYNLLQFTSTNRTGNHLADLVNAHLNEEFWSQQAQRLYEIIVWTREQDITLIVMLWPHITAVESSQPALGRVRDFMEEQGVPVVDMSAPLRENPSSLLIVNRFDTHPGLEAQRLAADALYPAVLAASRMP
jgi:hypothetical protein